MHMDYTYKDWEWTKHIKRKTDTITKEQAIQFLKSIPSVGRNVDNHYIEPEDDCMDKVIDYIKRSVDGAPPQNTMNILKVLSNRRAKKALK